MDSCSGREHRRDSCLCRIRAATSSLCSPADEPSGAWISFAMNLRPALKEDLPYIVELESRFRNLGLLGGDQIGTHERQMSDADCAYWIVETEDGAAGFVILRGLRSNNKCIELKRIAIAEPGRGLGREVLSE